MENTVAIKNRSNSMLVYRIPELGIRREFAPGETKQITEQELNALSYRPGGMNLLRKFLFVQDKRILEDVVSIKVEPEYYLDKNGVIEILMKNDNIPEFLDCLDFAPQGVLDMIKEQAVALPVHDSRKRDAIKAKLGLDVEMALKHLQAVKEEEARERAEHGIEVSDDSAPVRRVQVSDTGRRTTPSYKIVNQEG